ncbi:MAG: hypothetical protein IJB89_00115, partial [Akkermansia sp.]|nr:hypothetical protein [Akkermansia sp.]
RRKSQASRWLAVVNDLVAKLLHASRASGIFHLVHRPFDFVLLVNFPFIGEIFALKSEVKFSPAARVKFGFRRAKLALASQRNCCLRQQ